MANEKKNRDAETTRPDGKLAPPSEGGSILPTEAPEPRDTRSSERPGLERAFGRYRDVVEIGRGGMGAVFRALDPDLDRPVAIKLALGVHAGSGEESRFLREARITGQLEHPNIVPIHEVARTRDGRAYFSMKLVKGRSLREAVEEFRARPSEAEASRSRLLSWFLTLLHAGPRDDATIEELRRQWLRR